MNHGLQIIDCRRILSWTYCFGYYSFQEEGEGKEEAERQRLNSPIVYCPRMLQLPEFSKNLTGLTEVTHGFFDKLVKQLEKGFDDMATDYATGGEGNVCKNCGTQTSPFLEENDDQPMCNTCEQYASKNGVPRPKELWKAAEGGAGSTTMPEGGLCNPTSSAAVGQPRTQMAAAADLHPNGRPAPPRPLYSDPFEALGRVRPHRLMGATHLGMHGGIRPPVGPPGVRDLGPGHGTLGGARPIPGMPMPDSIPRASAYLEALAAYQADTAQDLPPPRFPFGPHLAGLVDDAQRGVYRPSGGTGEAQGGDREWRGHWREARWGDREGLGGGPGREARGGDREGLGGVAGREDWGRGLGMRPGGGTGRR
eukprot:gene10386-8327_t